MRRCSCFVAADNCCYAVGPPKVSGAGSGNFRPATMPPTPRDAAHRHFVHCILEDRPPLGTPEHARHVVEIMLAAAESSRTGHRAALKTIFEMPEVSAE